MAHQLPPLPYKYNALEPFIDEQTMRIHHDKHHQAYVDKLNDALQGHPDLEKIPVEKLLSNLAKVPENMRMAIRNHGGGHANHTFFWTLLRKGVKPKGKIVDDIIATWGSMEKFQAEFTLAALSRFGSGWAWLVLSKGKLLIMSTPNQDSPVSEGLVPLLTIDVWEHAYYLKYQNRRNEYLNAFFSVINWDKVNELYEAAR